MPSLLLSSNPLSSDHKWQTTAHAQTCSHWIAHPRKKQGPGWQFMLEHDRATAPVLENKECSDSSNPQAVSSSPQPAPQFYTDHTIRWCWIFLWLFWVICPVCVPSPLPVKINSIPLKPRTLSASCENKPHSSWPSTGTSDTYLYICLQTVKI